METSDAAAQEANQSEEESEIVTDEYKNRKIAAEVLKNSSRSIIFNELIENVEKMKLKNRKQSNIRSFFRS